MSLAPTVDGVDVPEVEALQLKIGGMSCSFCSSSIERALGRQKGVDEVHVSIAHEEALVRFRPRDTNAMKIKDTLRALGYTIRDPRKVQAFEEQEELERKERWDLASAALFAIILFGARSGLWSLYFGLFVRLEDWV